MITTPIFCYRIVISMIRCNFLQSLKKILRRGFRATLNFRKVKVALNPVRRIFLTFAKSCILSCWLQFDNKKWGPPSSFFSYKRLKLKLRVLLAGHIVAMVTYCATQLTATHSLMIGQFVDTIILASADNDPSNCKSWKVLETVSSHLKLLHVCFWLCLDT